ncbi:hypothetical protein [Nitrosospira sp. Nsp1]|uniref:hypothetical protein n=1 Tax=Nitrosospira sp. Nsp1 TaxID=136547 RepID=UPI0008905A5E|nr:hypothetical protein [Nitrosospira sp. Nsp1]SCX57016.1 PEP-CTERM protein-sorting domain-containing protein [Nitrosospira sp. Nsp1]
MKTVSSNLIKYLVVSALAITSVVAPLAAESALLSISAITHEQTGYRPNCASGFGGTTTGAGISSLVGAVSFAGSDCITPAATSFSFIGEMVFTVWGGDELFANYSGSFTPTAYPSIFSLTDSTFKITGGTGNFSGATGGGTLRGIQNIANGIGLIQLTGQVADFNKDENKSQPLFFYQRASDDPDDLAMIYTSSDDSLFPGSITLGDYFYQDQNGQLLAINALPASGSLSLLAIGLLSFIVMRRRKISNS